MKIAALSSRKLGSSANGQLQNRFGYQGSYSEFDDRTKWNEFELRMYDAQIGRWLQGDPYDQFASPYAGMGNNPVSGVDPTGGWTGDLPEVFVTATRNTGMSGFSGFQFLTALATLLIWIIMGTGGIMLGRLRLMRRMVVWCTMTGTR